jgi:cysteine desulfurase
MAHASQYLNGVIHENHRHATRLRDALFSLMHEIPGAIVNALPRHLSSPFIINMSFLGTKGEVLVHMLSEKGIYVSMGAACKARKKDKSALSAMGFTQEIAESALRFSFSHLNTLEEIATTKKALIACVQQLRKVSNYKGVM